MIRFVVLLLFGVALAQRQFTFRGRVFPAQVEPGCYMLEGCPCFVDGPDSFCLSPIFCANGYCGTPDPRATLGPSLTSTAGTTAARTQEPTTTTRVDPTSTTRVPTTACQLDFGCQCVLDSCAPRLRCVQGKCVDDPGAIVPERPADEWKISLVESEFKTCGCATEGERGKVTVFSKDSSGRNIHVTGNVDFRLNLLDFDSGLRFEPDRRKRTFGYTNGTAVKFLEFDSPGAFLVTIVASVGSERRTIEAFPVTVCSDGKPGDYGCACIPARDEDTGTCDKSDKQFGELQCNATTNRCQGSGPFVPRGDPIVDTPNAEDPASSGLNVGLLVGIAVAIVCFIALVAMVVVVGLRYARIRAEREERIRAATMNANGMVQAHHYETVAPGGTISKPLPSAPSGPNAIKTYGDLNAVKAPARPVEEQYSTVTSIQPPTDAPPSALNAVKTYSTLPAAPTKRDLPPGPPESK